MNPSLKRVQSLIYKHRDSLSEEKYQEIEFRFKVLKSHLEFLELNHRISPPREVEVLFDSDGDKEEEITPSGPNSSVRYLRDPTYRCSCYKKKEWSVCSHRFDAFLKCQNRDKILNKFPMLHLALHDEYSYYLPKPDEKERGLNVLPQSKKYKREKVLSLIQLFTLLKEKLKKDGNKNYVSMEMIGYIMNRFNFLIDNQSFGQIFVQDIFESERKFVPNSRYADNPFKVWASVIRRYCIAR